MVDVLYYKKNVPYTVVVRRSTIDNIGVSLNELTPWMAIPADSLMDFKLANKSLILDGQIVPSETPVVDWETPNALSDDDITELIKSHLKLRSALKNIDSVSTLSRLLTAAQDQDKSSKIKQLIRDRMEEVVGDDILAPTEMGGVSNL